MVIIDTSVLIEFFSGRKIKEVFQLIKLLENRSNIAVCGVIYQEVLQGIDSDKDFRNIKAILDEFIYLDFSKHLYLESCQMYRALRKKGVTIRKTHDLQIAAVAIENNIALLSRDRDFKNIAKYTRLDLYSEKKKI
ncbi:hypothetical protein MNBD_UNCLBAC01-583 [hydrothermal vent metagenome]|uniref:PIN domain-containing protein n=1 Tax=hydrothermal vent metagenome TaxID=652676 RepID=A0A3B1DQ08_9ZZZZ